MKFLLVTALFATAFVAPAQAADLLVEEKINAPYAPKYSPRPTPRPEVKTECYLSAAFGLIKVPCHEGFEYEEPGGDNPTTEVEEPRCEVSSKVPSDTKRGGKKGGKGKKGKGKKGGKSHKGNR